MSSVRLLFVNGALMVTSGPMLLFTIYDDYNKTYITEQKRFHVNK